MSLLRQWHVLAVLSICFWHNFRISIFFSLTWLLRRARARGSQVVLTTLEGRCQWSHTSAQPVPPSSFGPPTQLPLQILLPLPVQFTSPALAGWKKCQHTTVCETMSPAQWPPCSFYPLSRLHRGLYVWERFSGQAGKPSSMCCIHVLVARVFSAIKLLSSTSRATPVNLLPDDLCGG